MKTEQEIREEVALLRKRVIRLRAVITESTDLFSLKDHESFLNSTKETINILQWVLGE